jgi:hypothetical protein
MQPTILFQKTAFFGNVLWVASSLVKYPECIFKYAFKYIVILKLKINTILNLTNISIQKYDFCNILIKIYFFVP